MADLRAFRGYRYDLATVGTLSGVVAPPYDVIDPPLERQLLDASPFNAVRIELTKDIPGGGPDKYAKAAQTLRDWIDAGAIRQDTARSLYVYEQQFDVEGQTFTRRGFLARVRLRPFGQGDIYPHEQTMAAAKQDRLNLYRATNFNLSPVFGLYPDADGSVFAKLDAITRRQPPVEATDHLGVVNRLWVVTDQAAISAVIGMMGPKPVYIADGHHRYETGCRYAQELRDRGELTDPEAAANFTLMMLVGMDDPGLRILPTHRLVSGLPALTNGELRTKLSPHFDLLETYDNAAECWQDIELDGSQECLGFGTVADGQWQVARFNDPSRMVEWSPGRSADWRGLGVSILHTVVLDRLVTGGTNHYVHLLKEVTDAVAAKACQLACLVPAATMDHVERIAGHGETMPAKSTYFYPKLLTGMVFHSLKKE
jgi:uncharacterized protein (DUF1015 family)